MLALTASGDLRNIGDRLAATDARRA